VGGTRGARYKRATLSTENIAQLLSLQRVFPEFATTRAGIVRAGCRAEPARSAEQTPSSAPDRRVGEPRRPLSHAAHACTAHACCRASRRGFVPLGSCAGSPNVLHGRRRCCGQLGSVGATREGHRV
jgi:hypothetical protein